MQGFLVSLAIAILKNLIEKGSEAALHLANLEIALKKAVKESDDFDKVKNNPTATREDRKNAENDCLN